jgi:hypothetical protein
MPANDALAARLMLEFAKRTGLFSEISGSRRYLWTDAFAVCNFFELFARTGEQKYQEYAIRLIDQVHQVLGRYRRHDVRHGWISGLDEENGQLHPTIGVLRIGKPLKEREKGEPFDERLECTDAAATLGMQLQFVEVRSPDGLEAAFSAITKANAEAILPLPSTMLFNERRRVVELSVINKLPGMFNA